MIILLLVPLKVFMDAVVTGKLVIGAYKVLLPGLSKRSRDRTQAGQMIKYDVC